MVNHHGRIFVEGLSYSNDLQYQRTAFRYRRAARERGESRVAVVATNRLATRSFWFVPAATSSRRAKSQRAAVRRGEWTTRDSQRQSEMRPLVRTSNLKLDRQHGATNLICATWCQPADTERATPAPPLANYRRRLCATAPLTANDNLELRSYDHEERYLLGNSQIHETMKPREKYTSYI